MWRRWQSEETDEGEGSESEKEDTNINTTKTGNIIWKTYRLYPLQVVSTAVLGMGGTSNSLFLARA